MNRPSRGFRSVRWRLFWAMLFTTLVALIVAGTSLSLYDLHSYRAGSAARLEGEAALIGYSSSAALQFDDRAVASQNLAFLEARPTIRVAAIYNPRGGVFASYLRAGVPPAELPPIPKFDGVSIDGDEVHLFRRVVVNGEVLGTVYLAEDLGLRERAAGYAAILLAVVVGALLVAGGLSIWLQRGITRPIMDVSGVAREVVERRNYSVRATRTTRDEVGMLVDAVNEMLAEIERRAEESARLNKELERRVLERTAELEDSNLRLQQANQAKSNFLSMMSHEIRTPMNGVMGMLELLALGNLDAQQRTTLEVVRESGRSLLRIIDDILDFSKIEAGKLEVVTEVASVAAIVSSVVGIYAGNASSKSLVLKSRLDPRISPAVRVDPLRLQQILNNLVSNAIKFTHEGYVEITADLAERKAGVDVVRFSVTDTGVGIAPEAKEKLFQPFSQGGAGVVRVFGGTGLGLSIGQRLAGLMGGNIAITSQPGAGTSVVLTLPLEVADPKELPGADRSEQREATAERVKQRRKPPSIEQAQAEGTLLLVVDDHPINRMLVERQVRTLGYAAESASDGREALALWKSGRFALVVTDCNMPEMDGYELARAIRAIERKSGAAHTPVIACTANALKGEAENCFAAGMDDYIAKPIELLTLMEKLDRWLPIPGAEAGDPAPASVPTKQPDAASDEPVIDRSMLREIVGGNETLEAEVLEQFGDAFRDDVAAVESAWNARDAGRLAQGAHRMKGAARSIGAAPLGDVCQRVETFARAQQWPALDAARDAFRRECRRLEAFLDSAGSRRAPGSAAIGRQ